MYPVRREVVYSLGLAVAGDKLTARQLVRATVVPLLLGTSPRC